MVMLSVFHTHEWLVKYSKTIMDLWRRVIVFIILGVTEGLAQHSGGEKDGEDEEGAASGCLGTKKRKQKVGTMAGHAVTGVNFGGGCGALGQAEQCCAFAQILPLNN